MFGFLALKMLPLWLVGVLIKSGLYRWFVKVYRRSYATTSLQDVLDGLTDNKQLKLVLSYVCLNYGVLPKDAPFFLHANMINHFRFGGYYPVNGTSEIPFHMIQAIQRGGGKVLVQALVTKIVCDATGKAVGVRIGKNDVEIRAKYIISDAGVINTFKKLLPEDVARKSCIYPLIEKVGPSRSFITTFIGIDGSSRDLNLQASNIWVYTGDDINQSVGAYWNVKADEMGVTHMPFSFIAFPSTKDPEYETKFPEHGTALQSATFCHGFSSCLFDEQKVYLEVGTPVTNQHYLSYPHGEMYGLCQDMTRYTPEVASKLRPGTDINGLYLTGQDVFMGGLVPVVLTDMMCASQILHRSIVNDLLKLQKHSLHTSWSLKTRQ